MKTVIKKSNKQGAGSPTGRKKTLTGVIVSVKMEKTAVVVVKRLVEHPKYRKRYWISTRYKAHNPENQHKEGQAVTIRESRPLSKDKRWVILGRVGESLKK